MCGTEHTSPAITKVVLTLQLFIKHIFFRVPHIVIRLLHIYLPKLYPIVHILYSTAVLDLIKKCV